MTEATWHAHKKCLLKPCYMSDLSPGIDTAALNKTEKFLLGAYTLEMDSVLKQAKSSKIILC